MIVYDSLSLWVNATAVPNLSDLLPTYPILQRSSGAGHVEVTGVKEIDGLASLWPNQGASGASGASVLECIRYNTDEPFVGLCSVRECCSISR